MDRVGIRRVVVQQRNLWRLIPACLAASVFALVAATKPTIEDARRFLDDAETQALVLNVEASRADWVKSNFITADTEALAARADERLINAQVVYAKRAAEFNGVALPEDLARKMKLLRVALTIATPSNPKESEELTSIVASMEGTYGKGKYCPKGPDNCLDLEDLTKIMATTAILSSFWMLGTAGTPLLNPFESLFSNT